MVPCADHSDQFCCRGGGVLCNGRGGPLSRGIRDNLGSGQIGCRCRGRSGGFCWLGLRVAHQRAPRDARVGTCEGAPEAGGGLMRYGTREADESPPGKAMLAKESRQITPLPDILGRSIKCACGQTHSVPTLEVVYAPNVAAEMPALLRRHSTAATVALVADQRTYEVAGRVAEQALCAAGITVTKVIVPDPSHGSPVCDTATHDWLAAHTPGAEMFLAVGSGVINDLAKWLAFERGTPYVVLATAASMNGYTAANVAPTLAGVKSLVRAAAPLAVAADPAILSAAPRELTASGLGDVLAKPLSTADWLMNHLLLGEHYCPFCAGLINSLEPLYRDNPGAVHAGEPAALKALFDALIYSGLAMTMIGTSAPASGGEHLLSHTLDMMTSVDGIPHDLHGRQVGIGSIISAALYERLLALKKVQPVAMPAGIDPAFWGALEPSVAKQYSAKQPALATLAVRMADPCSWQAACAQVRPVVRSAAQIKDCLARAGAAHTCAGINAPPARVRAALLHSHEIRSRPTVIDMAWIAGILPGASDDLMNLIT
ncbi:MAG: hypothetical protein C0404_13705 [Verrucomicrobia bacterium]|nr:hypothetical protein [Verrucomicrobiota bacterium]